jgi:hypothetical protein
MATSLTHVPLFEKASRENFKEEAYLAANGDVARAVADGRISSGRSHFERFGEREGRRLRFSSRIDAYRLDKMRKVRPLLNPDMEHYWNGEKINYLTPELQTFSRISPTDKISSHSYDSNILKLIEKYSNGMILDCGAGCRDVYFSNVVNFEIVDYDTTDVLGIGETLPFLDNSFDAVISVAVLEHVRNPFQCAAEISRVLKPGGELFCCLPFLQPYHGYPHHYFNATHQGLTRLFEEDLVIQDISVPDSTHPVKSLRWILQSWLQGLPQEDQNLFSKMTVAELVRPAEELLSQSFCRNLPREKKLELASATVLRAIKPSAPPPANAEK